MKQILKFKIIIFIAIFLFSASSVFAAETFFKIKNSDIQAGDKFEAEFFLNTEDEYINAIEGKIIFPEKLFEVKEIRDGNSIINFWVERPKAKNGEILFSGIIPGGYGYLDKKGLIFSIIFQSIQEGAGLIETRDIKALLNDGKGTEANTKTSNLQIIARLSDGQGSKQAPASPAAFGRMDFDMPESFEPKIASDPNIFDGKYFAVFATQDKGLGIARYEVCEGSKRKCATAESPYLLQNQKLNKKIFVKAVDKAGNERVAVLPSQKPPLWYENYFIISIIILGAIVAYRMARILWQKFIK